MGEDLGQIQVTSRQHPLAEQPQATSNNKGGWGNLEQWETAGPALWRRHWQTVSLCPRETQKGEIWVLHNADLCKAPLTHAGSHRQVGKQKPSQGDMHGAIKVSASVRILLFPFYLSLFF